MKQTPLKKRTKQETEVRKAERKARKMDFAQLRNPVTERYVKLDTKTAKTVSYHPRKNTPYKNVEIVGRKSKSLKIRIDPLDALISEVVRKSAKGICERCGKYFGWRKLQACHFHSRRKVSVRYDLDNLVACDFGCHNYLDGNPMEKVEFFRNKLGQEKFDMLNSRARITYPKPDKKAIEVFLRMELKNLEFKA